MTPEQREKRIDRLFPWVAQPAPDFRGTVKSGTEFPKPTCPAGTEPVVQPIMPDLVAQSAGNQRVAVFYRETPGGGVIHLQTKASKGSWQEVAGISVRYMGSLHDLYKIVR